MKFFTQTKILTYIIVLLIVSNVSTIITIYYHKKEFHQTIVDNQNTENDNPMENRGYVFREALNLTDEQHELFKTFRRTFNRSARQISFQLQYEREELLIELAKVNSDTLILDSIAVNIGNLHAELKKLTSQYYISMKDECDDDQDILLAELFIKLQNKDGNVSLPKPGGRWRDENNNNN